MNRISFVFGRQKIAVAVSVPSPILYEPGIILSFCQDANRAATPRAEQRFRRDAACCAKQFKQMYDNPAINVALTFTEVFPLGLVVTLLSAGILRKKVRDPEN